MFLGCELSLFNCFQKILTNFQSLNNLCLGIRNVRNYQKDVFVCVIQWLVLFGKLVLPAVMKNNLLNSTCCCDLCINQYIIPLFLKFHVASFSHVDSSEEAIISHYAAGAPVLLTGLYLETGSVLQTGHFRDKLTVEKGKGFLYLSHLHSISKMWHSCLLFCLVRGEVNRLALN